MIYIDSALSRWLVDVRRDFHKHPEIAFEETRTSTKIADILQSLNIDTHRLNDMTGVIGLIRGNSDGPTIALRSDIDALPIQELNNVPYKSLNDGKMHACGHEATATILLGTAKHLMDSGLVNTLKGNVKLLFQPAEERGAGAKAMIERGVLEHPKVDRIIAGHMDPGLPVGQIGHFRSLGYASADRFSLDITGRGGHGARPEHCVDPIVAGAHFITQVQSIVARNIRPTHAAAITIGKFTAGEVANVIPESAYMEGSIRALAADVREKIFLRLQEITAGLDKSLQVRCDLCIDEGIPSLTNNSDVAEFLYDTSGVVVGTENVHYIDPIMGSEDFTYFTKACPGAIMRFGCANKKKGLTYPLHSPYFDIDESVLDIGVKVFTEAICRYLTI
jgi:amidohydrolase